MVVAESDVPSCEQGCGLHVVDPTEQEGRGLPDSWLVARRIIPLTQVKLESVDITLLIIYLDVS